MSYNQVILLLGTNLGDKSLNLQTAHFFIRNRIGKVIKFSEIMETEPVGFNSENHFLNQTILISTKFSPIALLNEVKIIEKEMGRIYTKKEPGSLYEDRVIDIDLLFFNAIRFESSRLTLPHHQVFSRNFIKRLLKF